MKKALLLILIILNSLHSINSQVKKEYYYNGKLESVGNYIGNDKHGEWKYYFKDGKLKELGNYKKGKRTGKWNFYKEYFEVITETGNYKNGMRTGEWKITSYSGVSPDQMSVGNYKKDKKIEEWKDYGFKKKDTISIGTTNYKYIDGIQNAETKMFGKSGQVMILMNFVDGKPRAFHFYYESGQVKESTVMDEKENGEASKYYENGQLQQSTILKNGRPYNVSSWFDIDGNPLDKGTLINGNGTINYYNKDGTLDKTLNYKDGKKVD